MKSFRSIINPWNQTSSRSNPPSSSKLKSTTQTPQPMNSLVSTSAVTIVELFQSQGCDSCPPANDFCITLFAPNESNNHLLLTYEVTYWDHLGWRDTFGDKRWDVRQRDYAAVLGQRSVYTPQVIVDGGARPLGGSGWRSLPAVLSKESRVHHEPLSLAFGDGKRTVRVSEGGDVHGEVLAVFYEMQPEDVRIIRGENRGRTLPHRNVVRDILVIGTWEGKDQEFEIPTMRNGLEMVVFVQAGRGGVILGAVKV